MSFITEVDRKLTYAETLMKDTSPEIQKKACGQSVKRKAEHPSDALTIREAGLARMLRRSRVITFYQSLRPYYQISTKRLSIMDQGATSRCWIFAGLHFLGLTKYSNFPLLRLSPAYISYWDTCEKVEFVLRSICSEEYSKLHPENPKIGFLLEKLSESGNSQLFMDLVKRHGVVPIYRMPETIMSKNSALYRQSIVDITYRSSSRIHKLARHLQTETTLKEAEQLAIREEITRVVENTLHETKKILSKCLGEPPKEFDFQEGFQKSRTLTPIKFLYNLGNDPEETVTLYDLANLPISEDGARVISISNKRSFIEAPPFRGLQLPMERIMEILKRTLCRENYPLMVSVFSEGLDRKTGMFSCNQQDYVDAQRKIPRDVDYRTSKCTKMGYKPTEQGRHVMVLTGMDPEGFQRTLPREFPEEHGPIGQFTNSWEVLQKPLFTEEWFKRNFYAAEVPLRLLPAELRAVWINPAPDDVLVLDDTDPFARL